MISKFLITTNQFSFCLFLQKCTFWKKTIYSIPINQVLGQTTLVSQLFSIVRDIYSPFHCYPSLEVRGIFLEISKAFDRVWHEGLIYKIQSTGISGTPLKLIKSFLSGRFQGVLLNGQASSWSQILAGVPQDSILGPLLCLIYINDLGNNLSSTVKQFADHKSIFSIVHDIDLSSKQLNDDLKKASDWAYHWKMSFNPDLSK